MSIITPLVEKFYSLDKKTFQYINLGLISFIIILLILFQLLFNRSFSKKIQEIEGLNDKKKQIVTLFVRKKKIEQEQENIKKMLDEDPYFRIKEYTESIFNSEEFAPIANKKIDQVSEKMVTPGYLELSLDGSISALTIDQLINFLKKCEENDRVYVKNISIMQDPTHLISLNFSLGTLKIQST